MSKKKFDIRILPPVAQNAEREPPKAHIKNRAKRVHVKPSSGGDLPVDGRRWREAPDDGLSM